MKKFKNIDLWVSIGLIVGFTIVSLIKLDYTFIIGYFTVGAWQVTSMIVHAINYWFNEKGTARYYYHRVVLFTCLTTILSLYTPFSLVFLYPLVFLAPVMAIFYTYLCYKEVYVKMVRPLDLLK